MTTCRTCGREARAETLEQNAGDCMLCARTASEAALEARARAARPVAGVLLLSVSSLLLANRNTSYRAGVIVVAQSLAEGLDELDLTEASLTARFKQSYEHFYIVDADLNQSGKAFAKIVFRSWTSKIDRWKQESKTLAKLKASLAAEYKSFLQAGDVSAA